jgi:protein TonB
MKIKKDILIESYPQRIKAILTAVLLLVALVAYAYPRFEREGDLSKYSFEEMVETFDIPATQQFIAPPPPSRPSIPVESVDEDFAEDITIAQTDLDAFADWEAPPPLPTGQSTVRFIPFDEPPTPVGGFEALLKNLVYPEIALAAGIEGTVVVQAFVDKTGRVTVTEILEGIPQTGMNEAAIAAIRKTHFNPAKQRDVALGVWLAIPITFQLTS